MIIEKNTTPFVIFSQDSIANALRKISGSLNHFVFCINERGVLEGILTNGDFLRWVVEQDVIDLDQPVELICNRNFSSLPHDADPAEIAAMFTSLVRVIPLVDSRGRLMAIAVPGADEVRIGNFEISDDSPAFLIAEIGINHNGSIEVAKQMVDAAVGAGANCAKFQMRHMEALYRNAGNPNDVKEDLGSQYTLDLLSRFLLSDEEMFEVFDYCRKRGILPLCTPWDPTSVEVLESYGVEGYKVASADLTNHELLSTIAKTRKPILMSTGMSTEAEIRESTELLKREGAPLVLLHCNSTYPAPYKDVNLKYLSRLREIGQCAVGYSGHERGYSIPLAAIALGAKVIEKHLTLDRDMEGNDHKVSLLPDEFARMAEAIRSIEEGMGSDDKRNLSQGERMNRETLGKSLVANRPIPAGTIIRPEMISIMSPGKGLQPNMRSALIGRQSKRDIARDDFFYPSDLEDGKIKPRDYRFRRPWGLPVRYHDYRTLLARAKGINFLEFHLSYKDMDNSPDQFFEESLNVDFTVHSPDLFAGDHLLNLAAEDETYRSRSIDELQRAIDVARELKPYFSKARGRIPIIASLGGFSKTRPVQSDAKPGMYERVAHSLNRLDCEGVEILPQTLPPYPWYIGGQLYCNLFVDAEDTARFCAETGYRLCFDVSHSKLACNERKQSFKEFTDVVGPHVAHLHIVDAEGVDGEGLQIGEGEIDFAQLASQLDEFCPEAAFIPEIWQGHKNDGEGFWTALERLERWF